jgi:hypothetical protein
LLKAKTASYHHVKGATAAQAQPTVIDERKGKKKPYRNSVWVFLPDSRSFSSPLLCRRKKEEN